MQLAVLLQALSFRVSSSTGWRLTWTQLTMRWVCGDNHEGEEAIIIMVKRKDDENNDGLRLDTCMEE